MAGQTAGICSPGIGDWGCSVRRDDVDVKIDEPLSGDAPAGAAHPMRSMASRTRETLVDVLRVLAETRVSHNLCQVVALPAKGIRAVHT